MDAKLLERIQPYGISGDQSRIGRSLSNRGAWAFPFQSRGLSHSDQIRVAEQQASVIDQEQRNPIIYVENLKEEKKHGGRGSLSATMMPLESLSLSLSTILSSGLPPFP